MNKNESMRALMSAYLACTMSMMAFVALVGPIARSLQMAPWQMGLVVTIGGVAWMALARPWGRFSDRRGRRLALLNGVSGFALSYMALCALLIVSLDILPPAWLVCIGLVFGRGMVGAFYAAIPTVGQAWVADHYPPRQRTAALASLGAASAIGLVLGPALAALLSSHSLVLPLYVTAVLPVLALFWVRRLPRETAPVEQRLGTSLKLFDPRLRRPMVVAFTAMSCVALAQITVGFFAIDRLQLSPENAARAAGLALTMVGIALIGAQVMVRRLHWEPPRLIRTGLLVAASGFAVVFLATNQALLFIGFFTSAAGMGLVFPAFSAMAANRMDPGEQGASAGSIGIAQGLGVTLGPLFGSLLYELGPGIPYLFASLVLIAVALWPSVNPVDKLA